MSAFLFKPDKTVPLFDSLQPATAVPSVSHAMRAPQLCSKPIVFTGPSYGSVVSMARILVAEGVRDRAIERAVRAAAADAAARLKEDDAVTAVSLPPAALAFDCTRSYAGKHSASSSPVNERGLKGSLFKRTSTKDIGLQNSINDWESGDVAELQVRSISVMRSSSTVPSPSARWQSPPLLSSSPPPPLPHAQQFQRALRFADNDLSAPFRQDLTIKLPKLHVLAPADAASEKSNIRRSLLLQHTLQQSSLLGPGHAAAASPSPSRTHSNMPSVLGDAMRHLSMQQLNALPGGSIKRNFALS